MPEKPSRAADYSKEQIQLVKATCLYIVALAFRIRGENKDAYDLYYHIRNFGSSVDDVAEALKPLLNEKETKEAIKILKEDFTGNDSVGAVRVARFITGSTDETIQADVVGFVDSLLDLIGLDKI